jgi:hypothetical protein
MSRLAIAAGVPLLIWPAFVNGYPLLFSDSAAFIAQLLQPVMLWDKPWVYGPVVVVTSLALTLWLPTVLQGLLLSWLLWRLAGLFRFAGDRPAVRHLGLCAVLALGSAAPWFASMLMPDIFAPITVLALFLLAYQPPTARRWPLIATASFAIAVHLAHLPLAAACAFLLLRRRRFVVTVLPIALAVAILLTTNAIGNKRFGLSPYGSVFLLARLVVDGPARDTLKEACPDPGLRLCDWIGRFPTDTDDFLWNSQGPVWTYPGGPIGLAPEASRIIWATIRAHPLAVAQYALANTMSQLVTVRVGHTFADFNYTSRIGDRLRAHYPAWELAGFMASLERRDELRAVAEPWQGFHAGVLVAGSVASLLLLARSLRRTPPVDAGEEQPMTAFILVVAVALLANAFTTGALSAPTDRYQARIAWLVLLPPLLWRPGGSNTAKTFGAA